MGTVERGFLLLADLTGYTAYLARGELSHAPAFLFAEDDRADPSLLLDSIEASYLAFRRRLRGIESATSCDCQACALAPRLDLKYFVHHGSYLRGVLTQVAARRLLRA